MQWRVVITTAPRKIPTLAECVESVRQAGWEPVVYAEPGSPVDEVDCEVVQHEYRHGVWHNWLKAARACTTHDVDASLTLQDDVILHPDSRALIEKYAWPSQNCGYLSLYTPKHYQHWKDGSPRKRGCYAVNTRSMWGAVALCFPQTVLNRLVWHPDCDRWIGVPIARKRTENRSTYLARWEAKKQQRVENPWMVQNSDTIIGRILRNRMKKELWYFNPSPASHIATTSACGHGGNEGRRNAYYIADFTIPLEAQIKSERPASDRMY